MYYITICHFLEEAICFKSHFFPYRQLKNKKSKLEKITFDKLKKSMYNKNRK